MQNLNVSQARCCGAPIWLIPVLGILLGLATGVLLYFGFIPTVTSVLIAMIVFALFAIILLTILTAQNARSCCLRKFGPWLIVTTAILLGLALFALGVPFVGESIVYAIVFAVISSFFWLANLSMLFTVLCVLRSN